MTYPQFNTDEAADYLGISKDYLYHLTSRGEIAHFKPGRELRFAKPDLDDFLESRRVKSNRELAGELAEY